MAYDPEHYVAPGRFKKRKRNGKKLRFHLTLGVGLMAIIGLLVYGYFEVLSVRNDRHYLQAVTTAYNQQQTHMLLTYQSVNLPVLTGSDPTSAAGIQQLAYINDAIKKSTALTDSLRGKDNLTVLPGTQGLKAVSQTTKQFTAMQQYVDDSTTFLIDYQDFITYVNQFGKVENLPQLTAFFNSLRTLDQATTAAQLLSGAQSASTDLDDTLKAFGALHPPSNLQQVNNSAADSLMQANNDFIDIISGIPGENSEQVSNSIGGLNRAADKIHAFTATNIAGTFRNDAQVLTDIQRLKAEHPLN